MAARAGMGGDNVLIDVDGPEVPVMDGSSAPFVFLIECADLIEQVAPRRYLRILKKVEVRDGEASAALLPAEGFAIDFEIERSEEHTSELQSLMRISYAVFCLKKKKHQ